jgi:predicted GIY-YIG superfamily endonuclease
MGKKMRNKYVYMLRDTTTDEVVYVGETYDVRRRWMQHTQSDFPRDTTSYEVVAEYKHRKDAITLEAELKKKYGLPPTESQRAGHWNKPRPILVHKVNGTYVGEYYAIQDAVRRLDLIKCDVYHVLAGRNKQHKGYTFQYKE